jgi:cobalt-zinc-cadmium efflux system protein
MTDANLHQGHDHGHDHHHGHAHHDHGGGIADNTRRLAIAFGLTCILMVVEVAGGIISGSLALLADAGHMLTDAFSLGLAWAAFHISERPADLRRTYGYHRFQVLAAFINGAMLLAIVGWIIFEGVMRLISPEPVQGEMMLGVAALGLLANIAAAYVLHGGDQHSLNMRSALLHVIGDLLGSVGAMLAAAVIMATGFYAADPIISIVISVLIVVSAWRVLRSSAHILMEGSPAHLDGDLIRTALLENVAGIEDIHHLHIWSLSERKNVVTLHARVKMVADQSQILQDINALLTRHFGISHVTTQIETGPCADAREAANMKARDNC